MTTRRMEQDVVGQLTCVGVNGEKTIGTEEEGDDTRRGKAAKIKDGRGYANRSRCT